MTKRITSSPSAYWRKGKALQTPPDDEILVAETHEEHLRIAYPKLAGEIDRLKAAEVPRSFRGLRGFRRRSEQLTVPGLCRICGRETGDPERTQCEHHPKNSGGGNSWQLAA